VDADTHCEIDDGERRVEFHDFGWAHTRGDGFMFLPKEKILATGDAVTNGPWNNVADANAGGWPKVVAAAQQLDVHRSAPTKDLDAVSVRLSQRTRSPGSLE